MHKANQGTIGTTCKGAQSPTTGLTRNYQVASRGNLQIRESENLTLQLYTFI